MMFPAHQYYLVFKYSYLVISIKFLHVKKHTFHNNTIQHLSALCYQFFSIVYFDMLFVFLCCEIKLVYLHIVPFATFA